MKKDWFFIFREETQIWPQKSSLVLLVPTGMHGSIFI